MSTEKPRLVVYSDTETLKQLDNIAKTQNRSRGNLVDTIIKEYLQQFQNKQKESPV